MRICICMVSGTLTLWLSVCFPAAAGQPGSEIITRTANRLIDRVLHQPFKALPQLWGVPDKDEETEQELELINPAQPEPSLSPEQRRQLSLWFEFMLDLMLTPGLPALVPVAAQNTCSDKPQSQKSVCLRPAPEDFSSPPATDETEKRNYSEKENSEIFQPPPPAASDTDAEITESDNPALSEPCYLDNLPNEVLKIILDYLSNEDLLSLGSTCRRLREFIDEYDEQYPHDVTLKPFSELRGAIPELSQDLRYIARVNHNQDVEVFINTGNGLEHKTEITNAQLKEKAVGKLVFSPDSRYLIIRTTNHRWCLDLTGSNALSLLSHETSWRDIIAFSPSSQYLMMGSETDLQSLFYQCDSGYLLNRHIKIAVCAAGFSPNDSCLAICTTEIFGNPKSDADKKYALYLYNLPLSKTDAPDFCYPLSSFFAQAVSFIDNNNLLIKDLGDIFYFQKMDSGWHCALQHHFSGDIEKVICHPKVGNIAIRCAHKVGLFWKNRRDDQWDLQQALQYSHKVGAIAFTPKGMNLGVGAGSELHLYTWDYDTNRRQYAWIQTISLTDHLDNINTIAFGSNGQLSTVSRDRLIIYQHWLHNSWLKIGMYRSPAFPFLVRALVSPDNSCIAIFDQFPGEDSVIQLFKVVLKSQLTP